MKSVKPNQQKKCFVLKETGTECVRNMHKVILQKKKESRQSDAMKEMHILGGNGFVRFWVLFFTLFVLFPISLSIFHSVWEDSDERNSVAHALLRQRGRHGGQWKYCLMGSWCVL